MLYLWVMPQCPNKHIAAYNYDISNDRFIFLNGILISKEQVTKPLVFDLEVTQAEILKYDAIPNNANCPLVNQKLRDMLLELAPKDIQFFDAEVRCKDGLLTNYTLVNITHNFIGMDHEKSIYNFCKTAGIINFIKYLTYKPGCMKNYMLARDEENLSHILVTADIKQAFDKAKIKGAWLVTPEEFYAKARGN